MKTIGIATLIGTAATAAALGLAGPATAAPTTPGNAQDTISSLQDQGYKVTINRLSDSPLAQANVVSVGTGPTFTHTNQNARATQNYTDRDSAFAPNNIQTVTV